MAIEICLVAITFALHATNAQTIGLARQSRIRFGGPPSLSLNSVPNTEASLLGPTNRRPNPAIPPRQQVPTSPNSFASVSSLAGSPSGSNFVNSLQNGQQNFQSEMQVDLGGLDFSTVAESLATNMFQSAVSRNSLLSANGFVTNRQQNRIPLNQRAGIDIELNGANVLRGTGFPATTNSVLRRNVISQGQVGSGIVPPPMANGNSIRINFGNRRQSNNNIHNMAGLSPANLPAFSTFVSAFPGFPSVEIPEYGSDSWFSYLKGLLDRTNGNLQIFSNSTGDGMQPIPQNLADLPVDTMPIYIKSFRGSPAYVPFRLPGQTYSMLVPFHRHNRRLAYPYLPLYIPYPNIGITVPETGMRFVAYLPFQPDQYRQSREGASIVFPQLSGPGVFPTYIDRRPVTGNITPNMG